MDIMAEFRKYAEDCHQMARLAADIDARATWEGLAERWERCAALQGAISRTTAAKRGLKAKV